MSEEAIWSLIESDAPRVWDVHVNGHWFARESAINADDVIRQCRGWLVDAYHFECKYNDTIHALIEVCCKLTDERAKSNVTVEV